MSQGIRVFEKNKLDLSFGANVTITMTDNVATSTGQSYVNYVRDRSNNTGLITTGSDDSANTQVDIDAGEAYNVDTLALCRHNWAQMSFQYYNGVSYVGVNPAVSFSGFSEPGNAEGTHFFKFGQITAQLFRIIINGTYPADADKLIRQIILTREIGQFITEPDVNPFTFEEFKNVKDMMSGKRHISKRFGGISCTMVFQPHRVQADQDLIQNIFASNEGRLFNFAGAQFPDERFKVPGFRPEDFYLMAPVNDQRTGYNMGRFANGVPTSISLVEVV